MCMWHLEQYFAFPYSSLRFSFSLLCLMTMVLNKPDDYKRSPDSQMHDDKTAGLVADHDVRSKDVFAQLADMDVGAALPIRPPLLDLILFVPLIEWLPMSFG